LHEFVNSVKSNIKVSTNQGENWETPTRESPLPFSCRHLESSLTHKSFDTQSRNHYNAPL
jgi:hypothetical protein